MNVQRLDPYDVDDSAVPVGELLQHVEDDDGWWVSAVRQSNRYEIRIYDVATVWLDHDLTKLVVRPAPLVTEAWLQFQLQLYVLPVLRLLRGEVAFHAGAVLLEPGAVLLLGDGHGGKSTTTALLVGEGAGFISDDQTGVTTDLQAVGTADLWLRPHSAELAAVGSPVSIAGDGRTVVEFQPAAPSSAIAGVLLLGDRIDASRPLIEPIEGSPAVTALLGQIFSSGLVPHLVERHFQIAAHLAATRPIARLHVPVGPPWRALRPAIERWLAGSAAVDVR